MFVRYEIIKQNCAYITVMYQSISFFLHKKHHKQSQPFPFIRVNPSKTTKSNPLFFSWLSLLLIECFDFACFFFKYHKLAVKLLMPSLFLLKEQLFICLKEIYFLFILPLQSLLGGKSISNVS